MPAHPDPPAAQPTAADPLAVIRSPGYLRLLLLAGLIGVPVSAVAYGFLELVSWLQEDRKSVV